MIEIKYSIRVFIDSPKDQVVCRIRWNKGTFEVHLVTGVYAEQEKWDPIAQKAKKGTVHHVRSLEFSAIEINNCISEFREAIDESFASCSLSNCVPTPSELKQMVNAALGRGDQSSKTEVHRDPTFEDLFEQFLRENTYQKNWNDDAREKYTQAYMQLTSAVPNISPRAISLDTMYKLRDWYVRNGYKNRTTNKQMVMVKAILSWINQQPGYSIPSTVLDFKTNLKVIPKTVTFLKFQELMHFYRFEFEDKDKCYAHARDLWCFMAFTSLRYSDLFSLRKAHIVNGDRIEMYTQKTDERIVVPLNEYAKHIIAKYNGKTSSEDKVLDVITNQKLNDYVKEAAKIAGLDRYVIDTYFVGTERKEESHPFHELISCHDARRTFVSCSLAMGMTPEAVMKCTGHRDYKTMKPYIETAVETQATEMSKWNRTQYRTQILALLDKASEEQLKSILTLMQAKVQESA